MRFTFHRLSNAIAPSYVCLQHDKEIVIAEHIFYADGILKRKISRYHITRQNDIVELEQLKANLIPCDRAKFLQASKSLAAEKVSLQNSGLTKDEMLLKKIKGFYCSGGSGEGVDC